MSLRVASIRIVLYPRRIAELRRREKKPSGLGVTVTIYRLYTENGNRAGFWVQHRTWSNTCAQVQSIAGRREGKLPDEPAPAEERLAVLMRIFDVRSGRPVGDRAAGDDIQDRNYARIAEPRWHHGEA